LGVLSFSFTKLSSLPSLQNRPPPVVSALLGLFASFPSFPFPSFGFPALPLFKNSSPPFAAASKGSGAAACAWGAGDTKPGQPALLPCLRCSPLLRVSGSGMHMGGMMSTLFRGFFLFIFYFCGDPKMGYNMLQCLIKVI